MLDFMTVFPIKSFFDSLNINIKVHYFEIKSSSFVELVKRLFTVFICNLLLNSTFNDFSNI